ncbi:hypothetical protein AAFF_G00356770 [Aldrovandia affinis]|uniref:Fork-head domain-containing protein n=1 Tax=Aldrovandia affinis TaxID=143900 RepID=A0AAD7T8H3_9TELE|nr:hypothetical protein AAFF_G00356770 [Aldrovandia affinis]
MAMNGEAAEAEAGMICVDRQRERPGPHTDPPSGDTSCEGGDRDGVLGKPSLSYIAMIGKVILSSPSQKLNLASIYADIEGCFPYYRGRGQGWKNSVRHNLSLNDCFVKLGRCEDGKGSYWGIHPAHLSDFLRGDFRQHRKASRSRRRRGLPAGVAGGDLYYWGAGPCLGPCPQCPYQPQWVASTLPHPSPRPWSLGPPGDAGRWSYECPPWRLPGWGVAEAELGRVGGACCGLCVRAPSRTCAPGSGLSQPSGIPSTLRLTSWTRRTWSEGDGVSTRVAGTFTVHTK